MDPSFTVGEAELLRRKSISKLKDEGMMDLNSSLDLPLLPRRFCNCLFGECGRLRRFHEASSLKRLWIYFSD